MSARILVVDDIPSNVKLLEARLMAEYFQVLTANNGSSAISICQDGQCDLVLLDVMMPEMDGFEVCRRLKENPDTMHIPVVMVTSLDSTKDRVKGLQVGADDFLTKPVNDLALVTRVKSLVRLKMITDDLRMRAASGDKLAIGSFVSLEDVAKASSNGNIVVVDDRTNSSEKVSHLLSNDNSVEIIADGNDALIRIAEGNHDLAIISLAMQDSDGLRLCSHLRSLERTRNLPILVMAKSDQDDLISRALEIGVNDYVLLPVDAQELHARVKTQMKRKRYNDCLRQSVQQTIEMAVRDPLTNLYNRHYFDHQFTTLFNTAVTSKKPIAAIMIDIDHFKSVNDTHGHDVGDRVIQECARRIRKAVRNKDMACRFGGEEFVVILPDTDMGVAKMVAERIRLDMGQDPVFLTDANYSIPITVSVGVSCIDGYEDTPRKLLKRADMALYNAKESGRNRVVSLVA